MKKLPQDYAFFESLFPPSLGGSISNSEKKRKISLVLNHY